MHSDPHVHLMIVRERTVRAYRPGRTHVVAVARVPWSTRLRRRARSLWRRPAPRGPVVRSQGTKSATAAIPGHAKEPDDALVP